MSTPFRKKAVRSHGQKNQKRERTTRFAFDPSVMGLAGTPPWPPMTWITIRCVDLAVLLGARRRRVRV